MIAYVLIAIMVVGVIFGAYTAWRAHRQKKRVLRGKSRGFF